VVPKTKHRCLSYSSICDEINIDVSGVALTVVSEIRHTVDVSRVALLKVFFLWFLKSDMDVSPVSLVQVLFLWSLKSNIGTLV
jgi:hypothetical protein